MNDTPRDADGAKLCAWCGRDIQQKGVGRSRDYCRRSCRQRAYEQRKIDEITQANARLIRHELTKEFAAPISSRDGSGTPKISSRDETRGTVDSSRDETKPAGPAPGAVPNPVRPPERGRASRRRVLPPPPGVQRAEEMPLPLLGLGFGVGKSPADRPKDADGEPDARPQ